MRPKTSVLCHSRTGACVAAAMLAMLAGTSGTLGQDHIYNRGANTNNWGDALNWDAVAPAPGAPPAGGGATRTVTLANAVANANRTTNVNNGAGNPVTFTLNRLTFEGGANAGVWTMTGSPLTFANNAAVGPRIVYDVSNTGIPANTFSQMNNDIILTNNLELTGAANNSGGMTGAGNGSGVLALNGIISDGAAGARGINLNMAGTGGYLIAGTNTMTGASELTTGRLLVGNNQAFGAGSPVGAGAVLNIRGGMIRAYTVSRNIVTNVNILGNFDLGETGTNAAVTTTFAGATTLSGARTVNIPNVLQPGVMSDLRSAAADSLVVNGVQRIGANGFGGRLTISAGSYRGSIDVASGTLDVAGTIGAAAARAQGVTVRRGVGNGARLMGNTRDLPGARGTPVQSIFLQGANRVTVEDRNPAVNGSVGGRITPGRSAGVIAINGEDVSFGAGLVLGGGSTYEWEHSGNLGPGMDTGYHDQLWLINTTASLAQNTAGEWPILEAGVINGADLPIPGQDYTIIDIDASLGLVSRVSGYFQTPLGQFLNEGATFTDTTGFQWQITYQGGDGNDVVLRSVPTPGAAALLALGGLIAGRRRRV